MTLLAPSEQCPLCYKETGGMGVNDCPNQGVQEPHLQNHLLKTGCRVFLLLERMGKGMFDSANFSNPQIIIDDDSKPHGNSKSHDDSYKFDS